LAGQFSLTKARAYLITLTNLSTDLAADIIMHKVGGDMDAKLFKLGKAVLQKKQHLPS
jgi:hypothetical protein